MTIAEALVALRAGDAAGAIRALVAAWRADPDVELAEAIERLSARADRAGGPWPLGGETDDEREAAWRALAATDDAAARHALIAALGERNARERMLELARYPDPRVARAVVDYVADGTIPIPFDWRGYAELANLRDPRVRGRLDDIERAIVMRRGRRVIGARASRTIKQVRALVTAAYPEAAPTRVVGDELRALRELRALIADAMDEAATRDAATEAALLAAIYATPDDDGPRAIYADWLLERGDPRGEFIAKQLALAPDPERRLVALLATHRARILGPLAPYVDDVGLDVDRGFVARAQIRQGASAPPMAAWATVTAIEGDVPATDEHPMPVLRSATGLGRAALERLAALAHPPPIERLGVAAGVYTGRDRGFDDDARAAFAAFAKLQLPTLARLELSAEWSWWSSSLGPRECGWAWRDKNLTELTVPAGGAQIAAWLVVATTSTLRRLRIPPGYRDYSFDFTRLALDVPWRVSVRPRHRVQERHDLEALLEVLEAITGGALEEIALEVHPKAWSLDTRRRFARLLADHRADPRDTPTFVPPR